MQSARVVDPYRLFDGLARLHLRLEVRVGEILVLEDPVQALSHRVLVAVQLLGHAGLPAELLERLAIGARSVLAAAIRVRHGLCAGLQRAARHRQGLQRTLGLERLPDCPTDDVMDIHVHHLQEEEEALLRVDVRDVRAERLVRGVDLHVPDQVRRRLQRLVLFRRRAAVFPAFWNHHAVRLHQPVEPVDAHRDAFRSHRRTDRVQLLLTARHRIDDALATGQQEDEVLPVRKACAGLAALVVGHGRPSSSPANPAHGKPLLLMQHVRYTPTILFICTLNDNRRAGIVGRFNRMKCCQDAQVPR